MNAVTLAAPDGARAFRAVVVVPAHNESAFIEGCLDALMAQRALDGSALPRGTFEVAVVIDHSGDDTAAKVERFAARDVPFAITRLTSHEPGVGWARRVGMDWGAARLSAAGSARTRRAGAGGGAGSGRAILASTDADTIVDSRWLAHVFARFDARPELAFVGGAMVYPAYVTAELAKLRYYATTWRKLRAILAPMRYVETPGGNFALDVDTYAAIGGAPLLTVGEDLAVAELAIAQGRVGEWIPVTNAASERRALGNPCDFLTGEVRFRVWNSHGKKPFQPCRDTAPRATLFADIGPDRERELTARYLRYYCRHHVIKPLVLASRLRAAALARLGLDAARFDAAVAWAERAHPADEPFYLEDRVMAVDRELFDDVHAALAQALAADEFPPGVASPVGEIPVVPFGRFSSP